MNGSRSVGSSEIKLLIKASKLAIPALQEESNGVRQSSRPPLRRVAPPTMKWTVLANKDAIFDIGRNKNECNLVVDLRELLEI